MTGVWIDSNHEVMYALASKITFICQMDFNAFPVDIQVIQYSNFEPVNCDIELKPLIKTETDSPNWQDT